MDTTFVATSFPIGFPAKGVEPGAPGNLGGGGKKSIFLKKRKRFFLLTGILLNSPALIFPERSVSTVLNHC